MNIYVLTRANTLKTTVDQYVFVKIKLLTAEELKCKTYMAY